MKFKKGDNIVGNKFNQFDSSHQWETFYEVKEIANGDLFSDQYYVLSAGTNVSMHDVNVVDQRFRISLQHILKNL